MKHVIRINAKADSQVVNIRAVMETARSTSAYENQRERESLGNALHQALREHGFNSEQIEFEKKKR